MEPPPHPHPNNKNPKLILSQNGSFINNRTTTPLSCPQLSDIEMVAFQTVTYTSLKDLLPSSPPPPPSILSSPINNSSWYEIPIKNPLVKQAALAYLQPMASPPEVGDKGLFWRLKELVCGGECGCIGWVNDVFLRAVKEVFYGRREEEIDEEEEEEEEEEFDEKVD